MESPPPRNALIAVDTNVLLDMALADDDVLDAIETIRKRISSAQFIVPPTVAHELVDQLDHADTKRKRDAAKTALQKLHRQWRFELINLVPVGHGIVEQIARRLHHQRLLPPEEVNDAMVLAEAALLGCRMLLTSDAHLRGIDFQKLSLELHACDVAAPLIATPREIVRKFWSRSN